MMPWLHQERIEAVLGAIRSSGAKRILDLGCGNGALLSRLIQDETVEHVVGIDLSIDALNDLRAALLQSSMHLRGKVTLSHGSIADADERYAGYDAAIMVEMIEHIDPDRLSVVERKVFGRLKPATVIVTTPNSDFNPLLGVPTHRFRHPDHRFEWGRAKFRSWAQGVGRRNDYAVKFQDLGGAHPSYGGASQMAIFKRTDPDRGCVAA